MLTLLFDPWTSEQLYSEDCLFLQQTKIKLRFVEDLLYLIMVDFKIFVVFSVDQITTNFVGLSSINQIL